MNVRSMCAVFGAPYARVAGGRRGLAALAGAIFALAVGAAHTQADENRTSAILRNDGPVLGIVYENTFGRRLANAVGLLFDHESALKNLPVPAYPIDNICGNKGGAPGDDIGEKIAIVRAGGLIGFTDPTISDDDIGEKIAIVRAAGPQEDPDQYIGWKFVPVEPGATVKLPDLCNWLNEPDAPSETWKPDGDDRYLLTQRQLWLDEPGAPSETWKPDGDDWYLLIPRLLPLRDPGGDGSFIMPELFIERAAFR